MSKTEQEKKSPLVNKRGHRPLQYNDDKAGIRAVTEEVEGGVPVRKLRGYAILFDVLGQPWRGSEWQEKISKSALEGVDLSKLVLLWNHDPTWVLARNGKNMRVEVDDVGLFVEATIGGTWFDDYVHDRVDREIVDGMSFYFDSKAIIATDWTNKIDIITKINEIYEVSLLPFPAYDDTVMITADDSPDPEPAPEDSAAFQSALTTLMQYM
ncbi:HK97 family phage prohead protease [Paenibacillus gansuensis]|uniref:HK97 family phage prohead protease n=1 Tax=Paenibacillus gansuensis TaxID=306542 RepID=A0ABW5PHT9_9BACL